MIYKHCEIIYYNIDIIYSYCLALTSLLHCYPFMPVGRLANFSKLSLAVNECVYDDFCLVLIVPEVDFWSTMTLIEWNFHTVHLPETSWYTVTIEGLKNDLTDLHCQVRVAAIATCASAAVNRPEVGPDPHETGLGYTFFYGWTTQQ